MTHPKLRVLIYARVSSPKQKNRGTGQEDEASLPTQNAAMEKAANQRGWVCVDRIEDVLTGATPVRDRPGGSRIYEHLAANDFDVLMVYDNDRIGRDQDAVIAKVFRADLRKAGKQVFSVYQPIEPKPPAEYAPYDDDAALWLESVTDTASSVAIRQLRRRLAFGMRTRIETKKLILGEPTGYVADRLLLPNGRTVLGQLRLDDTYAPIVRSIFDAYEAGGSYLSIARTLNREKIPTITGRLWSGPTIRHILLNPVYYGAAVLYKRPAIGRHNPRHPGRRNTKEQPMENWLIVDGAPHPAIITKEQWQRCQRIRNSRTHCGRVLGESHLLAGLVSCGNCGARMQRNGKWKGGYLSCKRHWETEGRECCRNTIRRVELERDVLQELRQLCRDPERLLSLHALIAPGGELEYEEALKAADARLADVKRRSERIRESYEAGIDNLVDYSRRKAELERDESSLAEQAATLRRQRDGTVTLTAARQLLLDALTDFDARFEAKSLRTQKVLVRLLIREVIAKSGVVTIVPNKSHDSSSEYENTLLMLLS